MIMVAMSYFCRQNMSQISLEIVVNCSHPSEILALTSYLAESDHPVKCCICRIIVSGSALFAKMKTIFQGRNTSF